MADMLSGGDMLIRALQDEGVEYVFGYPGGAALHIYDAIFRQQKVEHLLVRHEQAATHMADGYARATGRTGVVLVTSGPGATNAITGIATAYMDSVPMVVISAQVPLAEMLRYTTQLRSLTGGRGVFTMEMSHYENVPRHITEQIVAERQAELAKERDD